MRTVENSFAKIAIAVAFSPRCEAILAEARLIHQRLGAKMVFIHIGKKSLQEEQYLKHLLHRFELDQTGNEVVWREGDPVESIINICQELNVDLLVAGALEKESLLKYFMGDISRQLSRKVKCSMLLITEPSTHPKGFKYLVVEGTDHPKTENTISKAVELAQAYQASNVIIIQESDPGKMALIRSDELKENEADQIKEELLKEEDQKLEEILRCTDCGNLSIQTERIEGKPGYVISKYAREKNADLLVVNSSDKPMNLLDRVFPHDIEHALADLPCSLLIVHPKNQE
ncbi:MAG: universal stress protein [Bacteroidetes bacterium]|jgi:nucleotide-binding universal stress UspA family protein|nr:universal stress protein [Bacteroidota bacterium]